LHRAATAAVAGDGLGAWEEQGLGQVVAAPVAGLPAVVGTKARPLSVGDATEAVAFVGGGPELAVFGRVLGGRDELAGGVEHRVGDQRLAARQGGGGTLDRLAGPVAVGDGGGGPRRDQEGQTRDGGGGRDEE